MQPPVVTKLGDRSCKVNFAGKTDIISFAPNTPDATLSIDADAIVAESQKLETDFLNSPVSVWNWNRKNGIVKTVRPRRGRKQRKKR